MNTKLNAKANSSHNHSASNITSGTLPIARGGTSATSAAAARSALGAAAVSHTHDDRYYTEAEVNSKIQGVENMIQITMGGVKLVGSGSINKTIYLQGNSRPFTNPWQIGASGLPNGDFMRIMSFPFGISGRDITGGFNDYIVLKSSSENYAILIQTDSYAVNSCSSGYVWYKNDNSIMLKLNTTNTDLVYPWDVLFSYEIYKYQS